MEKSVFSTLNAINCNEHTEKKNGLTYLSWAWAWTEVKKAFPLAYYTIYETPEGRPYFDDGRTAWVKTGVTIEGLELKEYLPIMDYKNNSIPVEKVTSMDMNKTIQRSLTKCCARHGLGLYIYAGEDLPEESGAEIPKKVSRPGNAKENGKNEKSAEPVITDSLEFKPLDNETYWKYVRAEAENLLMKSGVAPRVAYTKVTHAGQKEYDQFMADVQDYRAAMADGTIQPSNQ